jgi:hypothetical protein
MSSDFLKTFFKITGHNLPDPSTLKKTEEKVALATHLRNAGEDVKAIAMYFSLPPFLHIVNYLQKVANQE